MVAEFAGRLDPRELATAKAAAAVMAMNNVHYRFLHLLGGDECWRRPPARLRMNAIATHGAARVGFGLWCLVVSAINGCGSCIASHEKAVREAGLSAEQVQAAVRIAAAVNAAAAVLDAERCAEVRAALA